ncbi:hypothetical protein LUX39_39645 [Actinomadura madurae]|nr:sigma factor [Actinomadura madurae]MCP9970433.1 hypothetical protein [Actinomadura madurae]MCQ0019147.1 hypothetical protein [Actinomadura madurae]
MFLVYDRHLAEDLLQVAYERVARRWRRLADGNPEAYARRVLVNLAIDENKRRARRRDTPVGSVADVERLAGAPAAAGAARATSTRCCARCPRSSGRSSSCATGAT